MSTPTGRAPRFASHPEKYAVPHPSSTTSFPETSPSASSSASGTPYVPHSISSCAQASAACASVYLSFAFVQAARFRRRSSEIDIGEPKPNLALRRLRRVRAVDEVVRHREREIAADRARRGVRRVRRAHRRPDELDRFLPLDDQRERRAGGDEIDELTEERLLGVLRVVLLREGPIDGQQARGAELEPTPLEARDDLPGERAPHGIRLDEHECPLEAHSSGGAYRVLPTRLFAPWRGRKLDRRRRLDGRLAVRADLPQRL